MIEINLIPDVKRELLQAQRARNVVISASIVTSIVAASVVAVLAVYIFGVQLARGVILDNQIKDKYASLTKVDDLSKILTIQNQLTGISTLNDSKNMTSRTFSVMSAITPRDDKTMSFSQITVTPGATSDGSTGSTGTTTSSTVSTGGTFHLEGQTSGYDSMEVFKKIIANTSFSYAKRTTLEDGSLTIGDTQLVSLASNISTSDISYGEDATGNKVLRFSLNFTYPAELLAPSSTGISFKLNVDGNVTDSYLGIPRFSDRAKDLEGAN